MGKVKEMCIDCNVNNEFAELQLKYDLAQRHIKILTDCLDVKEQLCAFFREQNEQLKEKVDIYERCGK